MTRRETRRASEGKVYLHCFYCDCVFSTSKDSQGDHFPIPKRFGGTDTVPCCQSCHDLKDRIPLTEWTTTMFARVVAEFPKFNRETRLYLAKISAAAYGAVDMKVKLDSIGERIDASTAMGKAHLHITGVFAELLLRQNAERTKEALAHKKAKGKRLGATPFGFRTPGPGQAMVPVPEKIEAAQRMLELKDSGMTYQAIADQLNLEGITATRGGKWYPTSVQRVVQKRDRYSMMKKEKANHVGE